MSKQTTSVLTLESKLITLPASTRRFVALKRFVLVSNAREAILPISEVTVGFQEHFLMKEGLIEEPRPKTFIKSAVVHEAATYSDVVSGLGDVSLSSVYLSEGYALMAEHGCVRASGLGRLLTSEPRQSLFPVQNQHGEPCVAVISYTPESNGSWIVDATLPANGKIKLPKGARVFYRALLEGSGE